MFTTALRRTARSCPPGSLPTRQTAPSIAPFTSHSRRHSSSKPPVPPNNGSPTIPASSVKQVGDSRSESKKPASESRLSKRKAAKAEPVEEVQQDNWTASFPSVPSTDHLNPKDLSIAAFYATYRPISITGPGPREAQMDEIDKLFQPKPKTKFKPAHSEVIYTLSSALENLDQQITDKQTSQQDGNASQKADLIKALTQQNDANQQQGDNQNQTINVRVPNGTVKLVIQEIQNRFRPFNVPPPPAAATQQELAAIDAEQSSEAGEEFLARDFETRVQQESAASAAARGRRDRSKIEAQLRQHSQKQQASREGKSLGDIPVAEIFQNHGDTFSVELDMQNGHFFTPHQYDSTSPQAATQQRKVRVGNRIRRGFYVPDRIGGVRNSTDMKLISVKRQRRLKMKKHKYKKLMRKTRNLRKKEGRI